MSRIALCPHLVACWVVVQDTGLKDSALVHVKPERHHNHLYLMVLCFQSTSSFLLGSASVVILHSATMAAWGSASPEYNYKEQDYADFEPREEINQILSLQIF
jgi:hypothetical protein